MKKILLLVKFFTCLIVIAQTPVTLVSNPTNNQINSSLAGPNITISGGTINTGKRTQIVTFTNGLSAGLQMQKGVYFSTGLAVQDLDRKNTAAGFTNEHGTIFSDPDLTLIDPNAIHDVISYEFSITLSGSATGLNIAYQFASEEYPDYIGSIYNDAFGFFVKGPGIVGTQNLAKLSNGKPTSINTINPGIRGVNGIGGYSSPLFDNSQSANYIRNGHTTQTTITSGVNHYTLNPGNQPGPFPLFIEHNGASKLINYSIRNLTPGGTYTFKIIIADSSDGQFDSGVFVKDIGAFNEINAQNDNYSFFQGTNVTSSILLNDTLGGSTATAANTVFSSSDIPAGFTLNSDGTISISDLVVPGTYPFSYNLCEKSNPIFCANALISIRINPRPYCFKPSEKTGTILDSNHGITSLGRAGAQQDNWPMIRKGAYTVLESKTKGFVINRLTTIQKNGLTPALGMAVYDTDLDCLSIYTGSAWKCYNKQTCTDPV